jgi:hypothetical protein
MELTVKAKLDTPVGVKVLDDEMNNLCLTHAEQSSMVTGIYTIHPLGGLTH